MNSSKTTTSLFNHFIEMGFSHTETREIIEEYNIKVVPIFHGLESLVSHINGLQAQMRKVMLQTKGLIKDMHFSLDKIPIVKRALTYLIENHDAVEMNLNNVLGNGSTPSE